MAHSIAEPRLFDRRHRIAAADDGSGAVIGRCRAHPRPFPGAAGEPRYLEDAHRPVPERGPGSGERILELGHRPGADVDTGLLARTSPDPYHPPTRATHS